MLNSATSTYRHKVTVTPSERRSEQQRELGPSEAPDGVTLSSTTLAGLRDPIAPPAGPPVPASDPQAGRASFTEADVQSVARSTEGIGRWTSFSTDSGLRGQLLEGTDGLRFKVLLPSGVLPQPLLLERDAAGVKASSVGETAQTFPAVEKEGRVEVQLPAGRAIFDERSYTFGMESGELLEADNTYKRTERYSYVTPDGSDEHEVTYGSQTFRQNMAEYVHPDGSHEIIADRERVHTYQQNGHEESISFYRIQDGHAEHVVKGEEYSWYSDPYMESHHHGTRTHPLDVERGSDGSYLLTPAGGLRAAGAAVANKVRNFGKMIFVGDQLQARPADLEVVKPFSVNP